MGTTGALNAIQLSVAPVFLLTPIAALIGALATLLGRIIDRARAVEERMNAGAVRNEDAAYGELSRARVRGSNVNLSLRLLTVAAALVGITVMGLFLGGATGAHTEVLIPWSFLGGLVSPCSRCCAFSPRPCSRPGCSGSPNARAIRSEQRGMPLFEARLHRIPGVFITHQHYLAVA